MSWAVIQRQLINLDQQSMLWWASGMGPDQKTMSYYLYGSNGFTAVYPTVKDLYLDLSKIARKVGAEADITLEELKEDLKDIM